ncbi:ABC transporter permease, partial [Mesorhizobium sp. M8A.F.Ca.ET.198.01.1.1]
MAANGGRTTRHIGHALLRAAVTLSMVVILNFILFRVIPGDPAKLLLGGARVSVTA